MDKSVSFSSASKNPSSPVILRYDKWAEDSSSFYHMKNKLLPGIEDSEKLSWEYYIFSEIGSKELYLRCRQDILIIVYRNFSTKEARGSLIVQLVLREAK